ncbi:MAG: site-2 protease family protein [Candidatus Hydromicrobium sp.]|nr:site-2 protease family protein [Candidatus Hydromicrobium sp.]
MFGSSIKLFKVFGIEIRLDYSWFIIFALFAYFFGFIYFPSVLPGLNKGLLALITVITVIFIFISVLIHEMSHSLVARRKGTSVEKITLFLFGGMAQIEKEPETPNSELIMAIAGPAASFVVAAIFGVIWFFTKNIALVREPVKYLAIINIVLGVFNMLPGYPLDGGRVLRSIVWRVTGSLERATFIASTTGRVIGFMIIAVGVFFIFMGNFLNGVWLAFIGWFLQSSAQMGYRQLIFETSIKGIKVGDVMNENIVNVTKDITIQDLVDDYFMKYRFGRFPVIEDEKTQRFIGVISLHDIKGVSKEEWAEVKIGDIVKSVSESEKVDMSMEISDAIKKMGKNDLGHLVIMSGNKLRGIITKSDVMRFIRIRSEFH